MSNGVRTAVIGLGWWSGVLAERIQGSTEIEIVSCYTRSEGKRREFADRFKCHAAGSYEEIVGDRSIEAVINTTPNNAHLETTRLAALAGKHVFLDKPIANDVASARAIVEVCAQAGVVLAVGSQRRRENQFRWIKSEIDAGRFGKLVQAECNISRDRLGRIDLSSWRYTADGMPGGVLLQIGIHYVDVLEMLLGPVVRVSARLGHLVLPGENPDVANMIMEHENNAISNLTASYASASEFYLMNVYGKEASAFYDLFSGLRHLRRGENAVHPVPFEKNDTIREELEEFAGCVRHGGRPEADGETATHNLAVIKAGVRSAREGRVVEVADILASGE